MDFWKMSSEDVGLVKN